MTFRCKRRGRREKKRNTTVFETCTKISSKISSVFSDFFQTVFGVYTQLHDPGSQTLKQLGQNKLSIARKQSR